MFSSLSALSGPAAVSEPEAAERARRLTWVMYAARVLCLVVVIVTVSIAEPPPGTHGHGLAIVITLGLMTIAWAGWALGGRDYRPPQLTALVMLGLAGGVLAGLSPASGAMAMGCMVTFSAATFLRTDIAAGILAATVAAFLIAGLVTGGAAGFLVGYCFAYAGMWTMGMTRHAFVARAELAEQTLDEARRLHDAETQAAALSERARIAREIHDVLAHSLAAVSVNLQAAEGLLSSVPSDSPELAKAIECIGRAGVFTREGLADARRAILALRADAAPLAEQLSALAEEYRSAGDEVDYSVAGDTRPVPAEAGLAAYRTAQEALTNARKHAPGEPVRLRLEFSDAEIHVRVANPLPAMRSSGPLAAAGAGYGLTGLRERAALGGGTLTAGPADGEWQVCLRIPA